jgi:hypothetical protein
MLENDIVEEFIRTVVVIIVSISKNSSDISVAVVSDATKFTEVNRSQVNTGSDKTYLTSPTLTRDPESCLWPGNAHAPIAKRRVDKMIWNFILAGEESGIGLRAERAGYLAEMTRRSTMSLDRPSSVFILRRVGLHKKR